MTTLFMYFGRLYNDNGVIDSIKYFLVMRNIVMTIITFVLIGLVLIGMYYLVKYLIDNIRTKRFFKNVDILTDKVLKDEDIKKLMKIKDTRKYHFEEVIETMVNDKYKYNVLENVWRTYKRRKN